jgi:hypothetical protein
MSLDAGGTTPAKLSEKLDALFEKAFRKQGQHVWIGLADNRLVLIWDGAGIPFRLAGARKDYGAIRQLGLQSDWPAIAADDSGASPGPPARLERSTLLGTAHVRELELAADTVFVDRLHVERRQSGCVRFSYLAPGSYGPHAYDCCPGDAWPEFVAQRYGEPGYMQLAPACSAEIRTGAGNGAEMGAFNELLQPQREANLRGNLEEYLRFGLEAGIIFVN